MNIWGVFNEGESIAIIIILIAFMLAFLIGICVVILKHISDGK